MKSNKSLPARNFFGENMTIGHLLTRGRVGALGLLIAAIAGLGAVSSRGTGSENDSSPTVLPVRTTVIQRVDEIDRPRTYTGVIAAARTAEVGFERTGRLIALVADEGEIVRVGQRIAELDTRRLLSSRRETVARRDAAQATLDELIAGPRKQTIAAARANVADLRAQVELQKRTFARRERLVARDAASVQDLEDSQFAKESAAARFDSAQRQLEELEEGTREEQIATQRAIVQQLNAAIEDKDIELEDSVLEAPFDGRIAARYVDEGTVISPGQSVYRIVEHRSLEARIGLPVTTVWDLEIDGGMTVIADGKTYTGKYVRALPEVDPTTRTRIVVIEIDAADAKEMVPGQMVAVEVVERFAANGFWLPTSALSPGVRGMWSAIAAVQQGEQTIAERRHVQVIHTGGDQVLVDGTLVNGDKIVVSGIQRIVPGQQIDAQLIASEGAEVR